VLVQVDSEKNTTNLLFISRELFFSEAEDNKTISGSEQHDQDGTYRPIKPFTSPRNNIQFDAFGNKRAQPIRIPNALKGSRPNAQPHARVRVRFQF